MSTGLSTNFIKQLETLQDVFIENNDLEGVYGDGKSLVNNEAFPITNNFTDGLYMRQMKMEADTVVISAIHHTNHFWFLLSGKVVVQADDETVEHAERNCRHGEEVDGCDVGDVIVDERPPAAGVSRNVGARRADVAERCSRQ